MTKLFDINGKEITGTEKYHSILQEKLWELEKHTRSEAARRVEIQQRRAKLKQQKDVYSADYIERELAKLENEERNGREEVWMKAKELIEGVYNAMQERHNEPLDLNDTKLSAALNLIALAGPKLDHAELAGIIDQFIGDPAALKTLRAVFDNLDNKSASELVSEHLYSPNDVLTSLKDQSDYAFRQGGSLNGFATAVNKIVTKEGMTFPKDGGMIDQDGVIASARTAAGLPETKS